MGPALNVEVNTEPEAPIHASLYSIAAETVLVEGIQKAMEEVAAGPRTFLNPSLLWFL